MLRSFYPRILMAPAGEESSGGNASEAKVNHQDLYENGDPNETFDNLNYESETSKKTGETYKETFKERIEKAKKSKANKLDDEDEEDEKPKAKEKKKEEKKEDKKEDKKKSDIDTLSDKEDGVDDEEDEKPKEKKEAKEKEKDKEESKDEKPKTEEEKALDKEKKGKIKIRMNGELYGIDPEATVRHKVDGEWVETNIQEALSLKSGEIAYDKKFTELGRQKKEIEAKALQVDKKAEVLSKVVGEVISVFDDPNKSPFEALELLFEKSGKDVYTAKRRMMESVLEEVEKLQGMSEAEVKAYWLEEKDRLRTKTEENRKKVFEKEQALTQSIQKVDTLRQTLGVSEEQFNDAWDEIEARGELDKYTDEKIVEYASIKPHIESVQDVLEAYEAQIEDSEYEEIVRDFAKQLRSKKLTLEQLKKIAQAEFMDEDLKDLTTRTKAPAKSKIPEKETSNKREYESFDDFED